MIEIEDAELLRRYTRENSEAAFAELVSRHINHVYACALRRMGGDAHLAEDVTQKVFTALATSATKLVHHPVLTGWLHTTTRFVASQMARTERRRRVREEEAHSMHDYSFTDPSGGLDWERLRPLLDEVLDELPERDREAVLLRFMEDRTFVELGQRLRLSENTARMRVERALDKMSGRLASRGVTSTVAALGLALTSQTGIAAPAGLATAVTAVALSGAAATATGTAGGLILFSIMNSTKIIVGTAGIITALAVGTFIYQAKANREALAAVQRERDVAIARVQNIQPALQREKALAEAADKDSTSLLAVIDQMKKTNAAAPKALVTHDSVQARYQRAQELDRNGDSEAALNEYLWCYDEGMIGAAGFGGVRSSYLLDNIKQLATHFPPALAALTERRDSAKQRMLASESDLEAIMDYASLNRELGDQAQNLATFEALPVGDSRRGLLLDLGGVLDQLVAARRYSDIANTRTYDTMNAAFAMNTAIAMISMPAGTPSNIVEVAKDLGRKRAVSATATDIEVLVGTGNLAGARDLADKLLAYDNSAETQKTIQERAARAGHPELFVKP